MVDRPRWAACHLRGAHVSFDRGPLPYPLKLEVQGKSDREWRKTITTVEGILDPSMREICKEINYVRREKGELAPMNGRIPENLIIWGRDGKMI